MMLMSDNESIATRRSLLSRLKNWDDRESWRRFFDTYWKLIYRVAMKSGLTEVEAQDVVQETLLSVAKRMRQFKYDPANGSFKNWLLVITRRRIADQQRKNYRQPPRAEGHSLEEGRTATVERVADASPPELGSIWDDEWAKTVLDAVIEQVKSKIRIDQYQIFDFYVLRHWPVRKVTSTLGVSATQVYLAKHRVMGLIKREVKRLEKEGL